MQENYRRAFTEDTVHNSCTVAPEFSQTGGMHAATVTDLLIGGRVARRIKIDEVSIWVTEINGSSAPGLRGGRLYLSFHQALQSSILDINVCDRKFQDRAPVPGCVRRSGDVSLLGRRRE
jgi:hypothetical protein